MVGDSFDRVEIEAFQKGSVLVDYYVYFRDLDPGVKTSDLKDVLNQQLEVSADAGDDVGAARLGRYVVDTHYTDFQVLPNEQPAPNRAEEERAIPDWAIAVIVIGLGSIAFVVIFGITVVRKKKEMDATCITCNLCILSS